MKVFVRYLVLGAAACVSAFGSLLPISNSDFTAAATPINGGALGNYSVLGNVPGYSVYGTAGTAAPGPAEFNLPSGITQTAFINGGVIMQTLTSSYSANTVYTLNVEVGQRFDVPLPSTYSVLLLSNGTVIGTLNNPVTPAPGSFSLASLTFDTTTSPNVVGSPVSFALVSNGGGQVNFSQVSIDASASRISNSPTPVVTPPAPTPPTTPGAAVPEPTTMAFMISGLGGLALLRRRSRK